MIGQNLILIKDFFATQYSDIDENRALTPFSRANRFFDEVVSAIKRDQTSTSNSIWLAAQKSALKLVRLNKQMSDRVSHPLRPDEIFGFIDLGLHHHFGSLAIEISWEQIPLLLKAKPDLSITLNQIGENYLPNSLWIEFSGNPPATGLPSWMTKIVGIMLTKIPLGFDKSKASQSISGLPQWKNTLPLLKTMCELESDCLAYSATAVQKEPTSTYRFFPTVFGHETAQTINDVFSLHADDTQGRKFREIERFSTEICLKAILFGETSTSYMGHTT